MSIHDDPPRDGAPTPIDPADIRPGDVVERRVPAPKPDRFTIRRTAPDGCLVDELGKHLIPEGWTWHLVHRPDPDAEAVEALLAAGLTDNANLIESDTARIARRYLANLREQGWEVTRRQNGQEHA